MSLILTDLSILHISDCSISTGLDRSALCCPETGKNKKVVGENTAPYVSFET